MLPQREFPKKVLIPKKDYGDPFGKNRKSVFTEEELEIQKTLPVWLVKGLNMKYGRKWMDDNKWINDNKK